jgi:hypothetical protein
MMLRIVTTSLERALPERLAKGSLDADPLTPPLIHNEKLNVM